MVELKKSSFFYFILRVIDWMNERRQEIYFILMSINVPVAIGIGIYMFNFYSNSPMFENPSTILEHFAKPIFISMLATATVLTFGTLLIHLVTMVPFRRISFFKMEMEFDSIKEKQIANKFLYASTMLHNHTENVKYLLDNDFSELGQVLQFLAESYKENALEYNDELKLEINVVSPHELKGRTEKKLYDTIHKQLRVKSNTAYSNRLIGDENILVGSTSVFETEEDVAIVVRRGYDNPFDVYDQETVENILGYAAILFDTILMIKIMDENNLLDTDVEK